MKRKSGILHVYLKPSKNTQVHRKFEVVIVGDEPFDSHRGLRANELIIVGDEEGLYRLWMAAGEAMVSRAGKGSFESQTAAGLAYETLLLRVEGKSNFLKRFPPFDA